MSDSISALAASVLELAERATRGTWRAACLQVRAPSGCVANVLTPQNGGTFECNNNADFIAMCRTAAPALARAVQEQAALLAEAAEVVSSLVKRIDHNGGLGEYQGGPSFVVEPARAIVARLRAAAQDRGQDGK